MESKHTPGPWRVEKNGDNFPIFEVLSGGIGEGAHIARLFTATATNSPQQEANAKLMAAAPDMLNALKKSALAIWDKEYADARARGMSATNGLLHANAHPLYLELKSAIEKAEGPQTES